MSNAVKELFCYILCIDKPAIMTYTINNLWAKPEVTAADFCRPPLYRCRIKDLIMTGIEFNSIITFRVFIREIRIPGPFWINLSDRSPFCPIEDNRDIACGQIAFLLKYQHSPSDRVARIY